MPESDFVPVLRFAVCSDLHIREANDIHVQRLRAMMQTVYAEAKKDPSYQKVDAFLFAGDLANNGKPEQFNAFWQTVRAEKQSETQILAVLAKNHDNWERGKAGKKTALRPFRSQSGMPNDFCVCINGFFFLGLSTCRIRGRYYTPFQKLWLRRELQKAAAASGGRPIFIIQHEHVRETVFGSSAFDGWGNAYFKKIFQKYPQLVHFSGHSHYPLNDPRSVWQGAFTAIGTGAMSYAELTVDNERKVHPPQHETIAQGWIAEADAAGALRLRGFDFLSGKALCTYRLPAPCDPVFPLFTPQRLKETSSPPRFAPNAAPTAEKNGDSLTVAIPAAASTDGFPVFLYRAYLKDAAGAVLAEAKAVNPYWLSSPPAFVSLNLPLHPKAATVCAAAENVCGMQSETIQLGGPF